MKRFVFAGATVAELDKQGRVLVPPDLARARGPRQGRRRRRRARPPRDLGSRRMGGPRQRDRRERRRCCRTCLRTDAADHVPVLARRGARAPRRAAGGDGRRRARSARAGTRACSSPTSQGSGKLVAIDRDPSVRRTSTASRRRARRADPVPARRLRRRPRRSSPPTACAPTRSCSTSASRRCRSTGPSAASRTRPTRRSTCGWIRRTSSSPRELVERGDERELETIFRRYGEERYARQIARGDRAPARASSRSSAPGELVDVVKASIPAPARFGEGHPAKRVFQALRIEVNDELDVARGRPPGRVRDAPAGRAARRHQLPLARGPDRQALPPRSRARLHVPARASGLRLRQGAGAARSSRRSRVRPSPREIDDNPRARSARLRAAVKV